MFKYEFGEKLYYKEYWNSSISTIVVGARTRYEVAVLPAKNYYKDLYDLKSETEILEGRLFRTKFDAEIATVRDD